MPRSGPTTSQGSLAFGSQLLDRRRESASVVRVNGASDAAEPATNNRIVVARRVPLMASLRPAPAGLFLRGPTTSPSSHAFCRTSSSSRQRKLAVWASRGRARSSGHRCPSRTRAHPSLRPSTASRDMRTPPTGMSGVLSPRYGGSGGVAEGRRNCTRGIRHGKKGRPLVAPSHPHLAPTATYA